MFSVYVHKRPIKIAFLINPIQSDWQEQIDAIWQYNQEKWGGRYNPIIPTDGDKIMEEWWDFVGKLDPDYIISVFPLSEELTKEIVKRICPIDVEIPKNSGDTNTKPSIHTYNEGLSALPNTSNISRFSRLLSNDILAAIRGNNWTEEKDVFRFLLRGFGIFQDVYYVDKYLEKIENKQLFHPNNKNDLVEMLRALDKPPLDFLYPVQFSMLGKNDWYIELEEGHSYDDFGLIVGDTFEEQLFLRNKVFYERDFKHNRLSHLWLPKAFTEDLEFMEILGGWLRRITSNVSLYSFSLSNEELAVVAENLDITKDESIFRKMLYKEIFSYKDSNFPFPKYTREHKFSFWDRYSPALSPPRNSDFYQTNNLRDTLEIKSPSQSEGISENGYWMAEVYIESDKNRYFSWKYYQNQNLWWCLPRKNYLASNIFKANSRVNSNGIPVVQMKGKNPFLTFQLPSEIDLLKKCILGDWNGKALGKVERKSSEIDVVEPSNIGKYLSGFFEMFGGLGSSYLYLMEKYWRDMFDILSGRDLKKDSGIHERVKNKLRKKVTNDLTKSQIIDNFENLSDFVIQLSKEVISDGRILGYDFFLERAELEHIEFQKEEKERTDWLFDENTIKRSISDLLKLGVIQMGFSQKCLRCGSRNWYLIDNASQYLVCDGCRYEFSLPANPEISYRLSSLVRQGIFTHGLVPVILVLGQLLADSRSSFFFAPSMDLYREISQEPLEFEKLTDSDIVCIQDGNLVIGEIKQSQELFTLNQMLDLAEIAESIEADILLFSSLDKIPAKKTNEMIDKVKERLKDTNVQVGWYQLTEEIFQPSRWDC